MRATLKDGERHIYAQRDFYIDEDSWQAAVIDHYDGRGELWRVAEAHSMQFYDQIVPWYAIETLYDLLSGRYLVLGLTNEESNPYEFGVDRMSRDYTPAALRRFFVKVLEFPRMLGICRYFVIFPSNFCSLPLIWFNLSLLILKAYPMQGAAATTKQRSHLPE